MKKEMNWLKWDNMEEWGVIYCPILDMEVMTYYYKGRPAYYSYTAPFVDDGGDICYCRYDHDEGVWDEGFFVVGLDLE